jgi:hypothetical protein
MPLYFSPVGNDQTFDANGDPLNAGQIETYLAGSSTPAATYTDDTGGTQQSNPIILNSLGYPTLGPIWLTGGVSYKFVIKNSLGATLRTIDNISGINDASVSQSEWVVSGFTATYINATSFSVPGDQTTVLQINRRLRTTNTSGFVYSSITNSVFAAGITTVTLVNDSGVLDVGLSVVEYGLLGATNSSIPAIDVTRFTMDTDRFLGRVSVGSGAVEELTQAQAVGILRSSTAQAQGGNDNDTLLSPLRLKEAQIQLGTSDTVSGKTSVNFSIPSFSKRFLIHLSGVSTSGSAGFGFQIGDSGGVEATGYSGGFTISIAGSATQGGNPTTYAGTSVSSGANTYYGDVVFSRVSGNLWSISGALAISNGGVTLQFQFFKTLSDTLTQAQFIINSPDTGDAGTVYLTYE